MMLRDEMMTSRFRHVDPTVARIAGQCISPGLGTSVGQVASQSREIVVKPDHNFSRLTKLDDHLAT
jgi:hypothetical protein